MKRRVIQRKQLKYFLTLTDAQSENGNVSTKRMYDNMTKTQPHPPIPSSVVRTSSNNNS